MIEFENVPVELRERPQWLVWSSVLQPGKAKPKKLPINPVTRRLASAPNPADWSRFEIAAARMQLGDEFGGQYSGLGFCFAVGDGIVGIDLDRVRDPQTGVIAPWAASLVNRCGSYAEVSPSKTGVKLWGWGRWAGGAKNSVLLVDGSGLEVFQGGAGFFAVTGKQFEESPGCLTDIQPELDKIFEYYFAGEARSSRSSHTSIAGDFSTSLERMRRFITTCGFAVRREKEDSKGTKFILRSCPFNAQHTAPDSYLYVMSSGAVGFHCSHTSCASNTWGVESWID
jgi:primase-polymerase (primpol)-like protein